MGYTAIGTASVAGNQSTPGTTAGFDTTGADLLVAVAWGYSGGTGVGLVTDSKSNTWTTLTARSFGNILARISYCRGGTVGAGHTVTTGGNLCFPGVWFGAFAGSASSPFDRESGATTASATSLAPGSVTPGEDGCLVVAGIGVENSTSLTLPSGYTGGVVQYTINNEGGGGGYLIQTSAAATNPLWSWTISNQAAAVVAVFKAVPAGSPAAALHHYLRLVTTGGR